MNLKETALKNVEKLFDFIRQSVSPVHGVSHAVSQLEAAGFLPLDFKSPWTLEAGGAYYCRPFDSELFAFRLGNRLNLGKGAHIAGAHIDWPCLRIKPAAQLTRSGYLQANVEVYGGPILSTFFDRPLSIAGKIAVKSEDLFSPRVMEINIPKPAAIIPNLAIHMSRSLPENGAKIDRQMHLLPLLGTISDTLNKDGILLDFIAGYAGVDAEDILDYELCLYNPEAPQCIGIHDEFISAPRLDDLTSACAAIHGLIDSAPDERIAMAVLFDNEEIGSQTKQGADATMLDRILEKIWASFSKSRAQYISDIHGSMILSADVGHGFHPNYPGVYDISTMPVLGRGFVIKTDSNQKYSWDAGACSAIKQLCAAFDIPYQCCVKRSDQAGGGTIGSLISSQLPVPTVDLGVPLLAMHSARELMGVNDQEALTRVMERFFSL